MGISDGGCKCVPIARWAPHIGHIRNTDAAGTLRISSVLTAKLTAKLLLSSSAIVVEVRVGSRIPMIPLYSALIPHAILVTTVPIWYIKEENRRQRCTNMVHQVDNRTPMMYHFGTVPYWNT